MIEKHIDYDKINIGSIVEVTTLGNQHFTGYVVESNINKIHPESSVITCRVIDGNVLATKYESLNIKSANARVVPLAGCKSVTVVAEAEISHPKIMIDEDISYDIDKYTCYHTKIPYIDKYITLCIRESNGHKTYGWSEGLDKLQNLQEALIVSYTGKVREESIKILKEDINNK